MTHTCEVGSGEVCDTQHISQVYTSSLCPMDTLVKCTLLKYMDGVHTSEVSTSQVYTKAVQIGENLTLCETTVSF
uniref:Uncharacterized protein n=1 Tax=Acrobeloides nanus TaxID=290746 RepID=A0A914DKT0_9BILA